MPQLSYNELNSIEELSYDLIKKKRQTPPVDVIAIAEHLGLKVIAYELGEASGALIIQNNKKFIGYNADDHVTRQRFTIAHEIGHYCLHCNGTSSNKDQFFVDKDFFVKYRNANTYTMAELKQEQQANAFAASLLMPGHFIEKELKKTKNLSETQLVGSLAKVFHVSPPAMTYRLDNLSAYFFK